jgi:hypothetical protein
MMLLGQQCPPTIARLQLTSHPDIIAALLQGNGGVHI